jgi:penicillin-binding protein, 1A family
MGTEKPVTLDQMSPHIKEAVIGIEDHNFYHHAGIDPIGITRAIYKNAQAHQLVEGGSTITQQLMKTMFFGPDDRTARRKIIEAFMALDVETCYSKNKILETYLNQIYFGRGAYGIEQAALVYFNKHAKKLTVPESAFLAALIKAPSELGNPNHLKKAKTRQTEVLDGMVECGYLTKDEATKAKAEKLQFKPGPYARSHPYYVNHVVAMVKEELGDDRLWKTPVKIYTNLDTNAQRAAEQALTSGVGKIRGGVMQGALVSIDVKDGGVIALIGGIGQYSKNQFNRALNPHTAGSAFKPFVYLAALIKGTLKADSVVNDAPIAISTPNGRAYTPQNFDNQFKGLMTVRDAIAQSRNVPAVQVAQQCGVQRVIDTAHLAGITTPMEPYPSLALGTCAISPIEMAAAYGTIARGGEYVEPQFIRHINEENGKLIKEFQQIKETRFKSEPVYQLVDALEDVVKEGTGQRAKLKGIAVAGKTGTADESKDVWFVGFTPGVVTAVWAGNDDNDAIHRRGITGGTIAASIWNKYMSQYYSNHAKPLISFANPAQPLTQEVTYTAYDPYNSGFDEFGHAIGNIGNRAGNFTNSMVEQFHGAVRVAGPPLVAAAPAVAPSVVHKHKAQTAQEPDRPAENEHSKKKKRSIFKKIGHFIGNLF